jgi:putative phosphoribosyl transferase
MAFRFRDRRQAGRLLAAKLVTYANRPDVLVLALPSGAIPIAFDVALGLDAPLDVFLVNPLELPSREALTIGAIITGGIVVRNHEVVDTLHIPDNLIAAIAAQEQRELARREHIYRHDRLPPEVRGRIVILVDDGLAMTATMRAAAITLRQQQPAHLVAAVPTAAHDTCDALRPVVDELICAITVESFDNDRWYEDNGQPTDDQVCNFLEHAARAHAGLARAIGA